MSSSVEKAKKLAAQQAVADHFSRSFTYVGIGSGSTIKYVVEAIAHLLKGTSSETIPAPSLNAEAKSINQRRPSLDYGIAFIPTGYQSRQEILENGLTPVLFDQLPDDVTLDVAFDGADEVDDDLNCIKGGGACLFQEKLVAQRARKFVCVADYRKAQPRLLTEWPSIPIEVAPIAAPSVIKALRALGSIEPALRLNPLAKSGPLKTDQDFYIIDAPFGQPLLTKSDMEASGESIGTSVDGKWEVVKLAKAIRNITGVLEVGLFCGYDGIEAEELKEAKGKGQRPVAVYFGLQDGSVMTRVRKGGVPGMKSIA
ncbi:ribose 5-phosphate isomerase [Microthyrium microscopicum]|uniref:Ribose-5-phosphate isomerase n=1 Tax=Microthyrium microscopicum TaxID=703497 RepID=A0A6A6TSX7_9PEZI|nr:ribose 5-phosphate isomerase [Microthyrium microscopicum]